MASPLPLQKTSLQLYRDCLRLVKHVAPGQSAKSLALRQTVRTEFAKNRLETDPTQIEGLKANAVRALSNYMLAMNAAKDPKVAAAMENFHGRSVQQAQTAPQLPDKEEEQR